MLWERLQHIFRGWPRCLQLRPWGLDEWTLERVVWELAERQGRGNGILVHKSKRASEAS